MTEPDGGQSLSIDASIKPATLCPACHYPMADGSIVCIDCGYHTKLGMRLKTVDHVGLQRMKRILLLALIPSCLAFIGGSYFLQKGLIGPVFLQVYFALFLLLAMGLLAARKLWLDTDYFNYAAISILLGTGGIRIYCGVMEGKSKFAFLVLAMTVSTCLFLLARTESNRESGAGEVFTDETGGLSWNWYLGLFGAAAALLGAVFFVPVVQQFGAGIGYFGSLAVGGISAKFLNWLPESSGSSDGGFWSSSCSSSSCGSSCGGGCGGGGCGGCGS